MPPKRSKTLPQPPKPQKVPQTDPPKPKQVQVKLFSKQKAEQPNPPQPKNRSKQFTQKPQMQSQSQSKTSISKWSYGTGKTPDNLVISSWNVNGIRSVMGKQELQKYVAQLKPDIVCINETKIDGSAFEKDKIELVGYHGYWNFCKCSAGYSGVAIFSKYLPISLVEDLEESHHSQQGRVLTMQFQKFYLVTAYIPNAGAKLDRLEYRVKDWDQSFQKHCQALRSKKPTIICGDLNVCHKQIDIARPKGNEKTAGFTAQQRESFTKFLGNGWVDTFRELHPTEVKYSWWSMRTGGRAKNIGWRLDYFVVNKEMFKFVKESRINNDIYGSDHCPIELVLEFK